MQLSWYNPIYTNKEDIVSTLDSLEPQLRAEIDKTLSYKSQGNQGIPDAVDAHL